MEDSWVAIRPTWSLASPGCMRPAAFAARVSVVFFAPGGRDNGDLTHPDLILPPRVVGRVPVDGCAQTLFPRQFGRPTEQPLDLARVAGMTHDLPGSIAVKGQILLAAAHERRNFMGDG